MTDSTERKRVPPPSNLTSLRARLRNHARDVRQVETRVQRRLAALVVNEILLGANLGVAGPPVLIKGGTAIDLRRATEPARLSKDLDAAVRGDLDDFIAQARSLLEMGWSGFTGRLAREAAIDVPGMTVKPRRFDVKLDYLGRPFATVPVELSQVEGNSGDEHDRVAVDEYDAIGIAPVGPVHCVSVRYQIAQKIHACTDPLDGVRHNDRARDLVDLQLLALIVGGRDLASIHAACVEIFAGRGRHSWPPKIRIWPSWPALYTAAASTLGDDVAPNLEQAVDWLRTLIDDIEQAAVEAPRS